MSPLSHRQTCTHPPIHPLLTTNRREQISSNSFKQSMLAMDDLLIKSFSLKNISNNRFHFFAVQRFGNFSNLVNFMGHMTRRGFFSKLLFDFFR